MIREIGRFFASPKAAKLHSNSKSAEGVTSNIIGDFVKLEEYADRHADVDHVLTTVASEPSGSKPITDLGYSTQEYDQAISMVRIRVEQGSLPKEVGQRFLQTLTFQRRLSFLRPIPPADSHLLTRRSFLILGGIALGAAAAGGVIHLGNPQEITPSPNPIPDRELLLDLQPKIELTERPSKLSNDGWRIRKAPASKYWESVPYSIRNGFAFHFDKTFGDNGIRLRAWRNEDGEVVPFLRVTALEGESLNYSLKTIIDKKGDLETEPVFFDNASSGSVYYAKFKLHTNENKFQFSGYYLAPLPLK